MSNIISDYYNPDDDPENNPDTTDLRDFLRPPPPSGLSLSDPHLSTQGLSVPVSQTTTSFSVPSTPFATYTAHFGGGYPLMMWVPFTSRYPQTTGVRYQLLKEVTREYVVK